MLAGSGATRFSFITSVLDRRSAVFSRPSFGMLLGFLNDHEQALAGSCQVYSVVNVVILLGDRDPGLNFCGFILGNVNRRTQIGRRAPMLAHLDLRSQKYAGRYRALQRL